MRKLLVGTFVALLLAGCGDGKTSDYEAPAKWAEWKANPKPYGGIGTLAKIREAEVNGTTELFLAYNNITDVSPLAGLTNLENLYLSKNQFSDLSPLKGLNPNLVFLHLQTNPIPEDQKGMIKKALPYCDIYFRERTSLPNNT